VAARSEAWVCGRSLAGIAGSNPAGGVDVSCEFCVLSSRGLCDGLITRPDREASTMRRPWSTRGSRAMGGGDSSRLQNVEMKLYYKLIPLDIKGMCMNISIPESTEIIMGLIEEDNADSQTSYEIYAGATAVARVLNISKSIIIKICVWSGMWVLVFSYSFSSKHFPLR
jgi:hypothetical protein